MLLRIAAFIVNFFGIANPFAPERPAKASLSNDEGGLQNTGPAMAKVIPLFPDHHDTELPRRQMS